MQLTVANDVPVNRVLCAAAAELDLAAFDLSRIEEAIVEVLRARPEVTDSETLRAIQAIDVLNQTLSTLAAFLDLAARDAATDARIDLSTAMAPVRMKAMAERLTNRLAGDVAQAADIASHPVELFDDFGT